MISSKSELQEAFTFINEMNPTLDDVERASALIRSHVTETIPHQALDVIDYYIWLQRYGAKY